MGVYTTLGDTRSNLERGYEVDGFFVYIYIRHMDTQLFLEPAPDSVNPFGFWPSRVNTGPINLSVKEVSDPLRAYSDKINRALRGNWEKNHEALF